MAHKTLLLLLARAVAMLGVVASTAAAVEVEVPVRLDLAFVRQTIVAQVFTGPGETTAWDDGKDCSRLTLREPVVDTVGDRLRIVSRGEGRVGMVVGSHCVAPVGWTGFVEVFEQPALEATTRTLTFTVVDSNVYDESRRKRLTTGILWDLVKSRVQPRLGAVHIGLEQPFDELRVWLPLVLPGSAERIERLVASLAVRDPRVVDDAVGITFAFTVELRAPGPAAAREPELTAEELHRWEEQWQRWDGFLTFVVKHFAHDAGAELRRALVEVLLDARYDILEALAPPEPGAPDPVPGLFVRTWEQLAPVLRREATGLPAETVLRYVGFIGAGDALAALTRLGPEIGLDVSADGLRRLARMVDPASLEDPVAHSLAVDPELRELLGFGRPLPPPEVSPDVEIESRSWLVSPAWAAPIDRGVVAQLNRRAPDDGDLPAYLGLIRDLLHDVREQTLSGAGFAAEFQPTYRHLVLATAWQESCWRQFVRKGGKLVALRSPVGSVGIMQVNEHVWRGLYELNGLRGDIAYNARAGSDILLRYLTDYAIPGRARAPSGELADLAVATYAVYNSGPGALVGRHRQGPGLRRVLEAFRRKYEAVDADREFEVASCYGA